MEQLDIYLHEVAKKQTGNLSYNSLVGDVSKSTVGGEMGLMMLNYCISDLGTRQKLE